MRISPIVFKNNYKQNFTSTNRTVYFDRLDGRYSLPDYSPYCDNFSDDNDSTKMVYSNRTYFLRSDLSWDTLGNYLNRQFSSDKVNVYNFACSDGSETYSLMLSLINNLGEEGAQRFFPIHASDIDPQIIEEAKKGNLKATDYDYKKIVEIIPKPKTINDYFEVEKINGNNDFCYVLHPKEVLTKNVIFECKSIEEGLDEVEKSNSLLLVRNFWRYLSAQELAQASMKLRKSIDKTSRILIGEFDKEKLNRFGQSQSITIMPNFLRNLGFYSVDYVPFANLDNLLRIDDDNAGSKFLNDEKAWLKQVEKDYKDYKLPYGIHCS